MKEPKYSTWTYLVGAILCASFTWGAYNGLAPALDTVKTSAGLGLLVAVLFLAGLSLYLLAKSVQALVTTAPGYPTWHYAVAGIIMVPFGALFSIWLFVRAWQAYGGEEPADRDRAAEA
jgi:hypothetical protein